MRNVRRVVDTLRDPQLWADPEVRRALLARVPDYRLSKFQKVLPDPLQLEMVGSYLIDLTGTPEFLAAQRGPSADA